MRRKKSAPSTSLSASTSQTHHPERPSAPAHHGASNSIAAEFEAGDWLILVSRDAAPEWHPLTSTSGRGCGTSRLRAGESGHTPDSFAGYRRSAPGGKERMWALLAPRSKPYCDEFAAGATTLGPCRNDTTFDRHCSFTGPYPQDHAKCLFQSARAHVAVAASG